MLGSSRSSPTAVNSDATPIEQECTEPQTVINDKHPADAEGALDDCECSICLEPMVDQTVLPICRHSQFCFTCIYRWSHQSRHCPLCMQPFDHLVHDVHSDRDFQRFYLRPLTTTCQSSHNNDFHSSRSRALPTAPFTSLPALPIPQDDGRDDPEVSFRLWVHRTSSYALHVGSNKFTRFRPPPQPVEFVASQGLRVRLKQFAVRELQVWQHVCDVPGQRTWAASYLVAMAQQLDLGSDAAVHLWAELCSVPPSESHHFLHELQHFLRSPFKTIQMWDRYVRYPRHMNQSPAQRTSLHVSPTDVPFDSILEIPPSATTRSATHSSSSSSPGRIRRPTKRSLTNRAIHRQPTPAKYSCPRHKPRSIWKQDLKHRIQREKDELAARTTPGVNS